MRTRGSRGFTLLELLVAMALLLTLLGFAYQTTVQFFRVRADQDAATSAQAKLRRVVEVLTQELRSSVLGAVIDEPYDSGYRQISFATLRETAGLKVARMMPRELELIAGDTPPLRAGDRALVVNRESGRAVVLTASDEPVRFPGPAGSTYYRWRLPHAGCLNPLSYNSNTLLFPLRVLGVRHDPDRQQLYFFEGGREEPFAYNIRTFRVDYVYLDRANGTYAINPQGFDPPDAPPKKEFGDYLLVRLRVRLETEVPGPRRNLRRTLVAPVELASLARAGNDQLFYLKEVVACN